MRVADGDTFTLLVEGNKQVRVRLHGIDCPERGQPFGTVATDFAKELLNKGAVKVEQTDIDRYGRTIGIVIIADSINLNERLLQAGLTWHYKYYDKNPKWAEMEVFAREKKIWLWKDKNPVAPWEWRKK